MKGLLECDGGKGVIYAVNPSLKVIIAFAAGMSAFAVKSISGALLIAFLTIAAAYFSGLGKKAVSTALLITKISILFFVIQLLCVRRGNTILNLGLFSITDAGLYYAVMMASKLIAASLPLVLVLSATKRSDLANSLVYNLHIPFKYAFALTTTLNFIPGLASEMAQVMEAQKARGVDFEVKNPIKKAALIVPLCLPLMLSCVRRTENSAIAAQLRGFELRGRGSAYKKYPLGMKDALAVLACAVVLSAAFIL